MLGHARGLQQLDETRTRGIRRIHVEDGEIIEAVLDHLHDPVRDGPWLRARRIDGRRSP